MIRVPSATAKQVSALAGKRKFLETLEDDNSYISLTHCVRYGRDAVEIDASASRLIVELIHDAAKEVSDRPTQLQASQVLRAMEAPSATKISNMRAAPAALIAWMRDGMIDGWLYRRLDDDQYMPHLLQDINFYPGDKRKGVDASVVVRMVAHSMNGRDTKSVTLYASDILTLTAPEIMSRKGYFHETPEFKSEFESSLSLYEQYIKRLYEQFIYTGKALPFERHGTSPEALAGNRLRIVLDKREGREDAVRLVEHSMLRAKDGDESGPAIMPFWPYLYAFNLAEHCAIWVAASRTEPYQYKPELRDKLVLPPDHHDLIEVLTSSSDILTEDIVEGKKGGTIVLCRGKPGLGKTLSAEVYSEVLKRPLYRVHSGQLGTDPEEIEKRLKTVLTRASRWNAVTLLDEADVFVRQRGDNIEQNALTAVFLRVLEYWDGILFMTTNRSQDIDDAILSRCMAIINYKEPDEAERKKLWTILAEQFQVPLPAELVPALVSDFHTASGRDIKNLLRLTKRYVEKKGLAYSLETFRQCAQFRGL